MNWGFFRTWFRNANYWYPITSWLGGLNPKAPGAWGHSPRETLSVSRGQKKCRRTEPLKKNNNNFSSNFFSFNPILMNSISLTISREKKLRNFYLSEIFVSFFRIFWNAPSREQNRSKTKFLSSNVGHLWQYNCGQFAENF